MHQQITKFIGKLGKARSASLKGLLLSLTVVFLFISCGIELQLYEWENMDLRLLDRSNRDTLNAESSIRATDFSILVSLNPENSITVRSSDWINASDGFQANDAITNIEITSNKDYSNAFASGEILNEVFNASLINNPETMDLELFLDNFGKQSKNIQEGFELIPNIDAEDGMPRDSLRTFTIRLTLREAGTFIQTTAPVKLTN